VLILGFAVLPAPVQTSAIWVTMLDKEAGALASGVVGRDSSTPAGVAPLRTSELARLTASDAAGEDFFGYSVAISGDTAVVGAPYDDHSGLVDAGAAYVFVRNHNGADGWGEVVKLTASDAEAGDNFGDSVAIDGDRVVVGAPDAENSPVCEGAAYVFERNHGGLDHWDEVVELVSPGPPTPGYIPQPYDFGESVAISGDTIIVGFPGHGVFDYWNIGAATIFERNRGGPAAWGEVTSIRVGGAGSAWNEFGTAVAINGDTVVVGEPGGGELGIYLGSAYVFERNHGGAENWGQVAMLDWDPGPNFISSFGSSVAIKGDTILVGAGTAWGGIPAVLPGVGKTFIYERNQGGADGWGEIASISHPDPADYDYFGSPVSISGETVLVGAYGKDHPGYPNAGSVYVFERNQGGPESWGLVAHRVASDMEADGWFGRSASISDDTMLVGAPGVDDVGDNTGSTYVFHRTGDVWIEEAKQQASDGAAGDGLGRAVAASGDVAVAGAVWAAGSGDASGAAYVFRRNQDGPDAWGEVAKLAAPDGSTYDHFGEAVAISGDTVVVGALGDDDLGHNSGSAYVYGRNQGGADGWGEVAKLNASDGSAGDQFGHSVSISGDTVVVGADKVYSGGAGSAYVFERNRDGAASWGEVAELSASDAAAGDYFGIAVSISGSTAVAGAMWDDHSGHVDAGSAYVFKRNTGGADSWGEVTKIIASDPSDGDVFGRSVSICNDAVVVGAVLADHSGLTDAGLAYVFERNQGGADAWGQVARLTASDAAAGARFGRSVWIGGDVVIVGAHMDDHTGLTDAGAVYVFERNAGGADSWGQVAKITSSDADAFDVFGTGVALSWPMILVGAELEGATDSGSIYFYRLRTSVLLLFSDDFESGDTSAWSAVMP